MFVFFFAIFVLTYCYFKCFRITTNASGEVRENKWQAQYKSLSFDAEEPQLNPSHPEPQELVDSDFTYLTPVFSRNESRNSYCLGKNDREHENEILPVSHLQEHRISSQETAGKQNNPILIRDDIQDHVYIEITDDDTNS